MSAEELSGIRALEIAAHALHQGDLDVAIVGAVDLCCEDVHMAAMPDVPPGDAAVVLVLKRLEDARRDGDVVHAILPAVDPGHDATLMLEAGARGTNSALTSQFGHAHACSGLLHVAAAALACHHRMQPSAPSPAQPWLPTRDGRIAEVRVAALGGQSGVVMLHSDPAAPPVVPDGLPQPALFVYSGADRAAVLRALAGRNAAHAGPAKLVLVAEDHDQIDALHDAARAALESGGALPAARFYERSGRRRSSRSSSGSAGAYHGMGRICCSARARSAPMRSPAR